MPYATVSDVSALNVGRATYSQNTKPTATQVGLYLAWSAAEIDAVLRGAGYTVPVATTATEAWDLLRGMNAMGAACVVERSAQNSPNRDEVCKAYAEAKKLLATLEIPGVDKADAAAKIGWAGNATALFQSLPEVHWVDPDQGRDY